MAEPPPVPPPPQTLPLPPNESKTARFKVIWRVLLISNLALGAYMFVRARNKEVGIVKSKQRSVHHGRVAAEAPSTSMTTITPVPEEPLEAPPVMETVKVRDPIPEDQQRELFQWILEEKRKVKPKQREEKKRIDEEKAILKQYIRAKSIPSL